jgi:hypothetical protein
VVELLISRKLLQEKFINLKLQIITKERFLQSLLKKHWGIATAESEFDLSMPLINKNVNELKFGILYLIF